LINETNIKHGATTRDDLEILLFSQRSHSEHVGEPQFTHNCIGLL